MGDGDSALTYTNLDHTWFDLHSLGNDVLEALFNTGVVAGGERVKDALMVCRSV